MKRITLVTDAFSPQINGVVRTLEQTIIQLQAKGFEISLIEPNMFKTVPCPTYPEIPLSWNIWKTGKMIQESHPDYLHIFTEGPLGLAAKIWADRRRIHYTTSYHTRYPEYLVDYFGGGLSLGYKAIKWFHGRAQAIMVNTESMVDLLENNGVKNRLVVWGRGVDTDLFTPEGDIPELFKNLPHPILLNVGRVAVEKNLPEFYKLPLIGSKVQVGSGPMLAEYQKLYPEVHFVGAKSGAELASYYRGADVFVFPSMSDTYGLVMLESIACGVPVAAYPIDGPKDVLTEVVGAMDNDLMIAVEKALMINRKPLRAWSINKSWSTCTDDFISYLTPIKN